MVGTSERVNEEWYWRLFERVCGDMTRSKKGRKGRRRTTTANRDIIRILDCNVSIKSRGDESRYTWLKVSA